MRRCQTLLSKDKRKGLNGAEKSKFLKPLARVFVSKCIVAVKCNTNIENLSRDDVDKVGPTSLLMCINFFNCFTQ